MKPLQVEYADKHITAIEGLRGVAIIMVMLYHYTNRFPIGWIGVDLFFVLSGFLISGILLRTKESPDYYKNFIAKRVLRIFPLYYFFLILFFVGFSWLGISDNIPDYDYLSSTQLWYWLYIQNWQIFLDGLYPQRDILSHFWSLAIEEQFYVFWPLVVYLVPSSKLVKVCIGLIFFSLLARLLFNYYLDFSILKAYYFTLTRLDGLAVGSFLAAVLHNGKQLTRINSLAKPIFMASGLGIALTIALSRSFDFENPFFSSYGYTLLAVFFGCLLMLVLSNHPGNVFKKAAESKLLTFFGKYSYGLYVYHFFVLRVFPRYLKDWMPNRLLLSLTCILISIALAYLSFHLFEKHFLKLKTRFQVERKN